MKVDWKARYEQERKKRDKMTKVIGSIMSICKICEIHFMDMDFGAARFSVARIKKELEKIMEGAQ